MIQLSSGDSVCFVLLTVNFHCQFLCSASLKSVTILYVKDIKETRVFDQILLSLLSTPQFLRCALCHVCAMFSFSGFPFSYPLTQSPTSSSLVTSY